MQCSLSFFAFFLAGKTVSFIKNHYCANPKSVNSLIMILTFHIVEGPIRSDKLHVIIITVTACGYFSRLGLASYLKHNNNP